MQNAADFMQYLETNLGTTGPPPLLLHQAKSNDSTSSPFINVNVSQFAIQAKKRNSGQPTQHKSQRRNINAQSTQIMSGGSNTVTHRPQSSFGSNNNNRRTLQFNKTATLNLQRQQSQQNSPIKIVRQDNTNFFGWQGMNSINGHRFRKAIPAVEGSQTAIQISKKYWNKMIGANQQSTAMSNKNQVDVSYSSSFHQQLQGSSFPPPDIVSSQQSQSMKLRMKSALDRYSHNNTTRNKQLIETTTKPFIFLANVGGRRTGQLVFSQDEFELHSTAAYDQETNDIKLTTFDHQERQITTSSVNPLLIKSQDKQQQSSQLEYLQQRLLDRMQESKKQITRAQSALKRPTQTFLKDFKNVIMSGSDLHSQQPTTFLRNNTLDQQATQMNKRLDTEYLLDSARSQYDKNGTSIKVTEDNEWKLAESISKLPELPYPDLFDRSSRTFAATFAKFGDLYYYTPVQRIGSYIDHTQRLKKKHILDLIAYLKTTKKTGKKDEDIMIENNEIESEEAMLFYLEHTLFIGNMPEEDSIRHPLLVSKAEYDFELQHSMIRVYEPAHLKLESGFEFKKVWSPQLMNQAHLSLKRYLKYIDTPDMIKNEEISKYNNRWMANSLDKIPNALLKDYPSETKKLFNEVLNQYARAMKQAMLEYVLLSPHERKRLTILMLPRRVPTATQRSLMQGTFSTSQFKGQHQRKLDAHSDLTIKLILNNLVTSSLLSWFHEFSGFNLVLFQNLPSYLPSSDSKGLTIEEFMAVQEVYRMRQSEILRQAWHRGSILVIKKFKYLRLPLKQKNNTSIWTNCGSTGSLSRDEYQKQQELINKSRFTNNNNQYSNLLQKYHYRTHTLLNNSSGTINIPDKQFDMFEKVDLSNLADIREASQYQNYVKMMLGGDCQKQMEFNGYEILAKEYKREIKYTAGNLMHLQLRQLIQESIQTILNYFRGFPTIEQLKSRLQGHPLRSMKITVTKAMSLEFAKPEQQKSPLDPNYQRNQSTKLQPFYSTDPFLNPHLTNPEFMLYQDHVNPIFKLDLIITRDVPTPPDESSGPNSSSGPRSHQSQQKVIRTPVSFSVNSKAVPTLSEEQKMLQTVNTGEKLKFTSSDEEILSMFEQWIDNVLTSFNDFLRPEFCKVKVISEKKYDTMNQEEKKQSSSKQSSRARNSQVTLNPIMNPRYSEKDNSSSRMSSKTQQHEYKQQQKLINFIEAKMNKVNYKHFMGRIQIDESDKDTKIMIDDKNLGVFSRPFVEKYFRITDPQEESMFHKAKALIRKLISAHLSDAHQVLHLYDQFNPILTTNLSQKLVNSFNKTYSDQYYSDLVKELRYYHRLALQLPTVVYLPMFQVNCDSVKNEILRRIDAMLTYVFTKFEKQLIISGQGICNRYKEIELFIARELKTCQDVIEMELYKNNLILEMTSLRERIQQNRHILQFLIQNDKVFEEQTWQLIQSLHQWPFKLAQLVDAAEERHKHDRNYIETMLMRRKDQFDKEICQLEEQIQEIIAWNELYQYRQYIGKIQDYNTKLDQYALLMQELTTQEVMLFGFKQPYDTFTTLKDDFFRPYYLLWTTASDYLTFKRDQLDSQPIANLDINTIQQTCHEWHQNVIEHQIQGHYNLHQQNKRAQKVINQLVKDIKDFTSDEQIEWLGMLSDKEETGDNNVKKWELIQKVLQTTFDSKTVTYNDLKYMNINDYKRSIMQILKQQEQPHHPTTQMTH